MYRKLVYILRWNVAHIHRYTWNNFDWFIIKAHTYAAYDVFYTLQIISAQNWLWTFIKAKNQLAVRNFILLVKKWGRNKLTEIGNLANVLSRIINWLMRLLLYWQNSLEQKDACSIHTNIRSKLKLKSESRKTGISSFLLWVCVLCASSGKVISFSLFLSPSVSFLSLSLSISLFSIEIQAFFIWGEILWENKFEF